ncbi:MAG TPA: PLP-dependent aminotransferase family protein [Nocardioidaceae bacterium]|nr:PLP-dependent aminotransferase family protein [Nocardioidaceae bacterium]
MVLRNVSASRLVALLGSSVQSFPAYRGLADGLRLLIADGRVPHGTRLPSERDLTTALGVSRTTVSRAYAELRDRGYLSSRRGSGSVVVLPGSGAAAPGLLTPGDRDDGVIDLTCAAPVAPPGTATAFEQALEDLPTYLAGSGYHPTGLAPLREMIAQGYTDRGLPTYADQIVVTTGALAAMAVVARALVGVGDRVLMESPTYPNAIATFRRSGARTVGVGIERDGWDTDALHAALRQTAPRAAVLIPDFQNPTGALMGTEQRAEVGHALARTRTTGIVDETLVDLRLDDVAMPAPLASFDRRAITIGSASKSFWGGLRIGWLRAPSDQIGALTESRVSFDLGAPVLEQLVLTRLLEHRGQVLDHRRREARQARAALAEAVRAQLPGWHFDVPPGGLALWCELPEDLSSALVAAAEREQMLLAPGPRFAVEGGLERYLRLPYTLAPEVLAEAVGRIATAWEQAQRQRSATARRPPLVA